MESCSSCCVVFASRRRHTRCLSDWSSDVCSSDLSPREQLGGELLACCNSCCNCVVHHHLLLRQQRLECRRLSDGLGSLECSSRVEHNILDLLALVLEEHRHLVFVELADLVVLLHQDNSSCGCCCDGCYAESCFDCEREDHCGSPMNCLSWNWFPVASQSSCVFYRVGSKRIDLRS